MTIFMVIKSLINTPKLIEV